VVIRIIVHPRGENPTNMPHASHAQRIETFHERPTNFDGSHCSREKGLPTQSTARRLTDTRVRTQFLSEANHWSSRLKPVFCRWQGTRLTRPISLACDRYVQFLLAGANPAVLNRHRRGLHPLSCRLSTYHSPTIPSSCLHFPPMSSARSPV
jgi:hypothetical protein